MDAYLKTETQNTDFLISKFENVSASVKSDKFCSNANKIFVYYTMPTKQFVCCSCVWPTTNLKNFSSSVIYRISSYTNTRWSTKKCALNCCCFSNAIFGVRVIIL